MPKTWNRVSLASGAEVEGFASNLFEIMETLIHLYFDPFLFIEIDFIVFYCDLATVLERGLEGHAVFKQRPD